MNIAKNMEAIFVIAVALASVTGIAKAHVAAVHAHSAAAQRASASANIAVVTITGKRLTAAEKAQLGD